MFIRRFGLLSIRESNLGCNEMTEEDFEKTIEATANVMTSIHQRLVRIEEWMLTIEEEKKNAGEAIQPKGSK